ncbi:MAG: hypothetical protein ACRD01_11225 [Terriglobales bacterium]
MNILEHLLADWQRWTCAHQWVRARWEDGTYGLRCSRCMKPYSRTWNELVEAAPGPRSDAKLGRVA